MRKDEDENIPLKVYEGLVMYRNPLLYIVCKIIFFPFQLLINAFVDKLEGSTSSAEAPTIPAKVVSAPPVAPPPLPKEVLKDPDEIILSAGVKLLLDNASGLPHCCCSADLGLLLLDTSEVQALFAYHGVPLSAVRDVIQKQTRFLPKNKPNMAPIVRKIFMLSGRVARKRAREEKQKIGRVEVTDVFTCFINETNEDLAYIWKNFPGFKRS